MERNLGQELWIWNNVYRHQAYTREVLTIWHPVLLSPLEILGILFSPQGFFICGVGRHNLLFLLLLASPSGFQAGQPGLGKLEVKLSQERGQSRCWRCVSMTTKTFICHVNTNFFPYRKTIRWVEKISLMEAFASYGPQSHGGWSICEILSIFWIRHCVEPTSTTGSGDVAGHHGFSTIYGLSEVPWFPLGLSFTCY